MFASIDANAYLPMLVNIGTTILKTAIVIVLAYVAHKLFVCLLIKGLAKTKVADETVQKVATKVSAYVIVFLAILILLEIYGVNTASLITILGAAGLAVGLALKDTLGNIASGIFLLVMRPYKIGDYVDCGSVSGSIRDIGFFCTVLGTPDGIDVVVPNSLIAAAPIKNYSSSDRRRVDVTIGIAYGDDLQLALKTLLEVAAANELVLKDPAASVHVLKYDDSAIQLQLRAWCANADYWTVYWQIQEALKGAIAANGLNIPFPQRVVTFTNKAQ